jgi:hypothetical protein
MEALDDFPHKALQLYLLTDVLLGALRPENTIQSERPRAFG